MNLQKLYELRLAEQKVGTAISALPTLAQLVKKSGGDSLPQPTMLLN